MDIQEPRPAPVITIGIWRSSVETVESTDLELQRLLKLSVDHASPAVCRAIAVRYLEHGVRDTAFDYVTQALHFDSTDAAAYTLRARLWYEWGFAAGALADAHRAAYFAPDSAATHHTLGAVLMALGTFDAARSSLERAKRLDPLSADIDSALCQLARSTSDAGLAAQTCRMTTLPQAKALR